MKPSALDSHNSRSGWTVVAVFAVTETVSWGVLYYAFAVFQAPMQRELGWSKAELTGAFSVALATSALAAFPVGRWLDRHSPRPLMTLGSLAGALLVLAWSQVHELLLFYLVWIGIGFAMACVLYEAAFTVVTKWFRERRRPALTAEPAVAAGAAVGSSAFWYLTAAFVLSSFAISAVAVHLIPYLLEGGRSAGFAAFAAGLMGLMQVPGRVVFAAAEQVLPRDY